MKYLTSIERNLERIATDGFTIVDSPYSAAEIETVLKELESALHRPDDAEAIRSSRGRVYAARNLLRSFPQIREFWQREPLKAILRASLGHELGLVRVLFFDKPPNRTWSLPWHRDCTIAVVNNRLPSQIMTKPTLKAGVPHVEAPRAVLERMLTLRIHLDEVTDENGPLQVIPGSHRKDDDSLVGAPLAIHARPGDVLVMRPLLLHSSGCSKPGTLRHRRILHLEFAAEPTLPDGFAWHDYVRP